MLSTVQALKVWCLGRPPQDADSLDVQSGQKKEGEFYVWTQQEIDSLLGEWEQQQQHMPVPCQPPSSCAAGRQPPHISIPFSLYLTAPGCPSKALL